MQVACARTQSQRLAADSVTGCPKWGYDILERQDGNFRWRIESALLWKQGLDAQTPWVQANPAHMAGSYLGLKATYHSWLIMTLVVDANCVAWL
ncbi:uncharacterized protein N7458_003452 [Penicillium daleae]|uniref:Uncharacterized protein n=1 Tax=Penicillium daleae TaxID=63821 RepID=A0AAD6CHM6_9EURO|nr:uncharacterized protein N7458_003452 [Penicillium daleae]KAJ5461900.1 hypothetical protein N7458_003452 [Penicillium daleae]